MGWVDPWVGSRFFSFWWVGSTLANVLKFRKDYVNAFKARSDKIWLHQAEDRSSQKMRLLISQEHE